MVRAKPVRYVTSVRIVIRGRVDAINVILVLPATRSKTVLVVTLVIRVRLGLAVYHVTPARTVTPVRLRLLVRLVTPARSATLLVILVFLVKSFMEGDILGIDNIGGVMDKLERAKICKTCYYCEQGVEKSISVDDKVTLCQKCYTCQQGIDKSVTAQNFQQGKVSDTDRASLCQNCYTCQQGVDKSVNIDNMPKAGSPSQQFTWFVFPTNMCNLKCKYCYANNKPGMMTKETAEKVISWLFTKQVSKDIFVHFFGGEPTYNWDILEFIVEVGNQTAKTHGVKVAWSMTTNGTMLDSSRLDWIEANFKKEGPFLLSIDGRPETHDRYRIYPKGTGSHKGIPVDEILKRWPKIECRPTIEPDTAKDWIEDYKWLRNKGFRNIAIEPDYETEWSDSQLWDYEKMLLGLGRYYILAKLANQPIYMKWIDGIKNGLATGKAPGGAMCGTAINCAAIDHLGYIFPCQRYASYSDPDNYAIGDVEKGWDEYKLLETQKLMREDVHGDILAGNNCEKCSAGLFCYKGCNAANRKIMGSREIALPFYCKLTQIDVRVALSVLGQLGELGLRQGSGQSRGCGRK